MGRHGERLLCAESIDDLDERMDELLATPDVARVIAILLPALLPIVRHTLINTEGFAQATTDTLGEAQCHAIEAASPILDAWLRAQHDLAISAPKAPIAEALALTDKAHEYLVNPEIPVEYAQAHAGRLRAEFCLLAIASALTQNVKVAPWLAHALVERLIAGARAHLRLLASLPRADIPETLVPLSGRLDFAGIDQRHRLARARAGKTLESAKAVQRSPSAKNKNE